jgi:hypothetical protein
LLTERASVFPPIGEFVDVRIYPVSAFGVGHQMILLCGLRTQQAVQLGRILRLSAQLILRPSGLLILRTLLMLSMRLSTLLMLSVRLSTLLMLSVRLGTLLMLSVRLSTLLMLSLSPSAVLLVHRLDHHLHLCR